MPSTMKVLIFQLNRYCAGPESCKILAVFQSTMYHHCNIGPAHSSKTEVFVTILRFRKTKIPKTKDPEFFEIRPQKQEQKGKNCSISLLQKVQRSVKNGQFHKINATISHNFPNRRSQISYNSTQSKYQLRSFLFPNS